MLRKQQTTLGDTVCRTLNISNTSLHYLVEYQYQKTQVKSSQVAFSVTHVNRTGFTITKTKRKKNKQTTNIEQHNVNTYTADNYSNNTLRYTVSKRHLFTKALRNRVVLMLESV